MEKPLLGGSLEGLTAEDRVLHYRKLAEEALRQASQATDPSVRSHRLAEAMGWHGLAAEAQKNLDHPLAVIGEVDADRPPPPSAKN